jgi:hypothetical protein
MLRGLLGHASRYAHRGDKPRRRGLLGTPVVDFPGGHGGVMEQPVEFTRTLQHLSCLYPVGLIVRRPQAHAPTTALHAGHAGEPGGLPRPTSGRVDRDVVRLAQDGYQPL